MDRLFTMIVSLTITLNLIYFAHSWPSSIVNFHSLAADKKPITVCASIQNSIKLNGGRNGRSMPVVDAFISKIEEDRWNPDDGDCIRATLDMLKAVKNNTVWAVWAWESMQPPVGSMYGAEAHLGNYDQCLNAPWSESHPSLRSQYCLIEVMSPKVDQVKDIEPFENADEYYKTPTRDGRRFNQHYFGVCLPSICSPSSVSKLAQHLLVLTHLPGNVYLDPRDCETAGAELDYPTGYYIFWTLIGILFTTTAYSTFCSKSDLKATVLCIITNSFCMKRNFSSLFTVSHDEVKVMHGMRFLTAVIIVIVHECFYQFMMPIFNGLDLNKILLTTFGLSMLHLEVGVDTFFAMSGLLTVRGLLMGKQKNVFYTLVKRYFRLVGPYALCIMYLITTAIFMDRGPIWKKSNRDEQEVCTKYWWKSLLMINTDVDSLCHLVTWYISCDFQMAILATALFWTFRKNRRLAIAVFIMTAVVSTVYLGLNVYWRKLDILPFTYKAFSLKRDFTDVHYTYIKSHARIGSYLVGMIMGYIITTYKPAEYKKVIGKKLSIIIASMSLLLMCTVLCVGVIFAGRSYDALEAAVVVATNRILWAVGICCLIGVCEYGCLPIIPNILSWSGFVPLSKLSYCLYLLHPLVIQLYKFNARGPALYQIYTIIVHSCGALVVSCVASLILHLILEAPLINITNELLSERKKSLEQNGTKKDINYNDTVKLPQNGQQKCEKSKLS